MLQSTMHNPSFPHVFVIERYTKEHREEIMVPNVLLLEISTCLCKRMHTWGKPTVIPIFCILHSGNLTFMSFVIQLLSSPWYNIEWLPQSWLFYIKHRQLCSL